MSAKTKENKQMLIVEGVLNGDGFSLKAIQEKMKDPKKITWEQGFQLAKLVKAFITKSGYLNDVIQIRTEYIKQVSEKLKAIETEVDNFEGKEQDKLNLKAKLLLDMNTDIELNNIENKDLIDYVLNDIEGFISVMSFVLNISEEDIRKINFEYLPGLLEVVHNFLLLTNTQRLLTKLTQTLQTMTPE